MGSGGLRARSAPNVRRRSRCSNGVSSACLTGYCPAHFTSRRCGNCTSRRPQGDRRSVTGCVDSASSSCVATMCLQHCVNQSCAIRRPDGAASCRHCGRENLASRGCLGGCCGSHCHDRQWVTHVGSGGLRARSAPNVCR